MRESKSVRNGASAAEAAAACVAAAVRASAEEAYHQGILAAGDLGQDEVHQGTGERQVAHVASAFHRASGEASRLAETCQVAAVPACREEGDHADLADHACQAGEVARVDRLEAGDRAHLVGRARGQVRRVIGPGRGAGSASRHWEYRHSVYLLVVSLRIQREKRRSFLTCRRTTLFSRFDDLVAK